MTGLLQKEFYIFKSISKTYLIIWCCFALATVFQFYMPSFFVVITTFLFGMLPITTMKQDELSRWTVFAAATPATRAGIVNAKYLFGVLGCLLALAGNLALVTALSLAGRLEESVPLGILLFLAVIMFTLALVFQALLLPINFRFGTQKGSIAMIVIAAGGAGAIIAILSVAEVEPATYSFAPSPWLLVPLLLIGFLALCLSKKISSGIMKKKEL